LKNKESSREAVLRVMQDGVDRTDAEIEEITGLSHSKVSGARSALWEAGLIEPLEKQDKKEHLRWRLCHAERQEEARRAFRDSAERRTLGRLGQKSAGERANIVIHLLSDDKVNDALMAQLERGRTWRRARARSRDVRKDKEADRRARRSDLKRAMDEADANVHFRQTISHLRDLMDVLYVVGREVEAERARRCTGEVSGIAPSNWPGLALNVREILEVGQSLFRDLADLMDKPMESCPLCGERLHTAIAHLDEGYIDGDAVEVDDVERT
jgi:DNA-binding transcriptional ArsR family regulator